MNRRIAYSVAAVLALAAAGARAGEGGGAGEKPEPKFTIKEEDLQRVPVRRGGTFPWLAKGEAVPKAGANAGEAPGGLMDVSGGDIYLRGDGAFSRFEREQELDKKEVFALVDHVQIDQLSTHTILRGNSIEVVRDIKTGNMEKLAAKNNVEMNMPGRSAKGAKLEYITEFNENGQLIIHMVMLEGDREGRKPATLWSEKDAIQSYNFIMDLRQDTFRAVGGVLVNVTLAVDTAAAPAVDAPAPAAGGMLPSLAFAGGIVSISCDGELLYESFSGQLRLKRNVIIRQAGLVIHADELLVKMESGDAAEAAPVPGGVFSGAMQSLECTGRVEIQTSSHIIQCDKIVFELANTNLKLEMNDAEQDVKIYFRDTAQPNGRMAKHLTLAKHRIEIVGGRQMSDVAVSLKLFNGEIPRIRQERQPIIPGK